MNRTSAKTRFAHLYCMRYEYQLLTVESSIMQSVESIYNPFLMCNAYLAYEFALCS
jgi:hypothetical protein